MWSKVGAVSSLRRRTDPECVREFRLRRRLAGPLARCMAFSCPATVSHDAVQLRPPLVCAKTADVLTGDANAGVVGVLTRVARHQGFV